MIAPPSGQCRQSCAFDRLQPVNPERLFSRVVYVVAEQFETAHEVRQEGVQEGSADRLIGVVSSPDAAGRAAKHSPPHQVPNSAKGITSMQDLQPGVTDAAAIRVIARPVSGRLREECGTPVDNGSRGEPRTAAHVAMSEW